MAAPANDLLRRQRALEKTAAKYRSKPFAWGSADCLKLARSHLVNMGHKPPKPPSYKSAIGARTALKKAGHSSLESLLDALLPRIAPAAMLPGDLALMEGEPPFDAVTVCVGRKLLGWFEGHDEAVMITPQEIKGAWRA